MSFERTISGMPAEPAPPPTSGRLASPEEVTPALRLQILSTEHWSLLATRSLAWNESFSRAGMFLSTLSGAIVALALVGQGSAFGQAFVSFAIFILPVVLFIGLATVIRMGASNYSDAMCVMGMNRIRAGYLEMAPDLERFFVMSAHDDLRGIGVTMGFPPGGLRVLDLLGSAGVLMYVINSVIAAALVGLIALQIGLATSVVLALSVIGFLIAFAAHGWQGRRALARGQASIRPIFPSPADEGVPGTWV